MSADTGPPRRGDPALGVFETLRVQDGRAPFADAHLDRLTHSLHALYERHPPDRLSSDLSAHAARLKGPHRLRIDAVPSGAGIEIGLISSVLDPGPPTPVQCTIAAFPGGLGPHKLRDRARLDTLARPGIVPLLADLDGTVLEAAWGNLWLREDDRLITPPADGRLLPGVMRARLLTGAAPAGMEAVEELITRDRLLAADAVFLTSALRLAVSAEVNEGAKPDGAPEPTWLETVRRNLAEGA